MRIFGHIRKSVDSLQCAACSFFLCSTLVLLSSVTQARPADFVEVRRIPNINLGTWTGVGSLSNSSIFCLASANDDNQRPGGGAALMPYQVKVENDAGPGGDFYLYLNNDTSATGSSRIRVSISHRDILDGNSYEQLGYGIYDSHSHLGQFSRCRDNGDNSEIRLDISASELSGKLSGRYRGEFSLTAIGGTSGSATDGDTFRVDLRMRASPQVQITGLDNLNLGSHAGLGNINASERFCVYSTSASGSYSLSVSSTNQDGGGNFFLDSTIGLGQIAYELYFVDSGTGPGTVNVTNNTVNGFGNSADQFCNGQNNATLSVIVREQNLQQAKSGAYVDTLIILVSPQ